MHPTAPRPRIAQARLRMLALALALMFLPLLTTAATACTEPAGLDGLRAAVLAQVNQERERVGAGVLFPDRALNRAAQFHACDRARAGRATHRGILFNSLRVRLWGVRYRFAMAVENIGAGQTTPAEVVAGWMSSPGHRDNVLVSAATEFGLGVAVGSDGWLYWVMVAAAPR